MVTTAGHFCKAEGQNKGYTKLMGQELSYQSNHLTWPAFLLYVVFVEKGYQNNFARVISFFHLLTVRSREKSFPFFLYL